MVNKRQITYEKETNLNVGVKYIKLKLGSDFDIMVPEVIRGHHSPLRSRSLLVKKGTVHAGFCCFFRGLKKCQQKPACFNKNLTSGDS